MENKDLAIVFMVAGISSRFGGKIKQFAKVGPKNETLIEYSLNQALPAGFTKIIFIIGEKTQAPFKKAFKDHYRGIPIYYPVQTYDPETRDKPWGTVDALCAISKSIDCPFVVCNGDDIYGKETFKILAEHLKTNTTAATLGYKLGKSIPDQGEANRGIFKTDEQGDVKEIKEVFDISKQNLKEKNLSPDDLCSMNIFALHPKTVYLLKEILDKFKQENAGDRKAECLLPNELGKLIDGKKLVMKLYPTDEQWFGVTRPEDEEIVRQALMEIPN